MTIVVCSAEIASIKWPPDISVYKVSDFQGFSAKSAVTLVRIHSNYSSQRVGLTDEKFKRLMTDTDFSTPGITSCEVLLDMDSNSRNFMLLYARKWKTNDQEQFKFLAHPENLWATTELRRKYWSCQIN